MHDTRPWKDDTYTIHTIIDTSFGFTSGLLWWAECYNSPTFTVMAIDNVPPECCSEGKSSAGRAEFFSIQVSKWYDELSVHPSTCKLDTEYVLGTDDFFRFLIGWSNRLIQQSINPSIHQGHINFEWIEDVRENSYLSSNLTYYFLFKIH
jgi:hypothetical protein